MVVSTVRCLPRYLVIRLMISNSKLLFLLSVLVIILGFGIIWLREDNLKTISIKPSLKPTSLPISSSVASPSAAVSKNTSATLGIESEGVKVIKVVDGDTLQIEGGSTVRFIGIDTPETKDPRR